ncbi:MAG: MFS transporter [Acidobacteriaceae bacterium]
MNKKAFMQSGHFPTLMSALLYFDVSFMVWVLLGPLAPFIADQLKLTGTEKGLLLAIPLLGGALFRPVLGLLGDRIGGRKAGLIGMTLTLMPLILGWHFAHTLWSFYVLGLLLGISGASFAVALPLAGRWYPPEQQGLVMGIAGAGNTGTLLATLFAPRLAQHFGVPATFAIAAIPLLMVMIFFAISAKDSPTAVIATDWSEYAHVLKEGDTYWMSFLYSLTFGGFVGLTSFLSLFFSDQYHLSKVQAGDFTTLVVVAGSFLRPVGGWFSDKVGGYRFLLLLLVVVGGCLVATSFLPPLMLVSTLLFIVMAALGMGNGAVFQLVPQRFPAKVGIITGIVGAAGGLGGFFLPFVMGVAKDKTGQYAMGLLTIAIIFFLGSIILLELGNRWSANWDADSVTRAGIFSYRSRTADVRTRADQPVPIPVSVETESLEGSIAD